MFLAILKAIAAIPKLIEMVEKLIVEIGMLQVQMQKKAQSEKVSKAVEHTNKTNDTSELEKAFNRNRETTTPSNPPDGSI